MHVRIESCFLHISLYTVPRNGVGCLSGGSISGHTDRRRRTPPRNCSSRRMVLHLMMAATVASGAQFTRGQLLKGLGGCVAALPLACEAYARAPPGWKPSSLPPLSLEAGRDNLVLVLHGAGGPDANTRRIADALQRESSSVQVVEYVYAPFVGDQLQAPFNAMRVGQFLADEVLRATDGPKRVHVVGVSVGAFAADRVASRLADAGRFEQVRLTLLDPFTARGLLGLLRPESAYGVTSFGRKATIAESVFNRDDPVPSTNLPLQNAINVRPRPSPPRRPCQPVGYACRPPYRPRDSTLSPRARLARQFDITEAAEKRGFVPLPGDSLHSWPAAWFGKHPRSLDERRAAATLARGAVVPIP